MSIVNESRAVFYTESVNVYCRVSKPAELTGSSRTRIRRSVIGLKASDLNIDILEFPLVE